MWRLLVCFLVVFSAGHAAAGQLLANPCFNPPFYHMSGNGGRMSGEIADSWGDNTSWATVTAHYSDYSGTVEQLAQLSVAARAVLKSVDPANMVLAPAVSVSPAGGTASDYSYALGYIDRFLAAGGGKGTDVMTVHAYATPPETSAQMLPDVRLVMARHGFAAPLWETEGSSGDSGAGGASGAAILARKYLVDLVYGAQRFIWYDWGPEVLYPCPPTSNLLCVGTVGNTPLLAPNAAGLGLEELESWLVGATVTGAGIDGGGTWQIALTLAGAKRAAIVWNPGGAAQTTLPGGLVASATVNLAGVTSPATGAVVTATPSPALFR